MSRNQAKRATFESDLPWYVAYTNPKCEFRAALGFEAAGLPFYLPTARKIVIRRQKKLEAIRPLFPRYIFVADIGGTSFEDIRSTHGIKGLLGVDGSPIRVPSKLLDRLHWLQKGGATDDAQAILDLPVGGLVEIMDGPFQYHIGKLRSANPKKRVDVLLEILGREAIIRVEPNILRPVDS